MVVYYEMNQTEYFGGGYVYDSDNDVHGSEMVVYVMEVAGEADMVDNVDDAGYALNEIHVAEERN